MVVPQNGSQLNIPIYQWMTWGYPNFRKPPCRSSSKASSPCAARACEPLKHLPRSPPWPRGWNTVELGSDSSCAWRILPVTVPRNINLKIDYPLVRQLRASSHFRSRSKQVVKQVVTSFLSALVDEADISHWFNRNMTRSSWDDPPASTALSVQHLTTSSCQSRAPVRHGHKGIEAWPQHKPMFFLRNVRTWWVLNFFLGSQEAAWKWTRY